MTAREFLQYFGSDICRILFEKCWTSALMTKIHEEAYRFCIIDDLRFKNEHAAVKKCGGKIIKLNLPDVLRDFIVQNKHKIFN